VISPHVGFENRVEGGSIVANNLHISSAQDIL
jgi:hypothetical protein